MIFETIIISTDLAGKPHVAPFGVRHEGENIIISPYKPSKTLDNILASKTATLNITDDVRVFAGALTKHEFDNIKYAPLQPNSHAGYRLAHALSHIDLALTEVIQDDLRPQLIMQKVAEFNHKPFAGFNRAQAAVVELCILVSRLAMLPKHKVMSEMQYLQIALDKTAGERELQAWAWLATKVEHFYAKQVGKNQA